MKSILYCATALRDIQEFPTRIKQRILRLLEMLAERLELQPNDFKYVSTVGMGTYDLRVKADKQYRVFYVAKFEEAIYVLHAFIKKTPQTSQRDIEKGQERYKTLLLHRQEEKNG